MHKSVRTAFALGTVLIVAAGAWQGYRVYRHESEALERARLWADFSTCLIGEPLAEGETLAGRFRGIELTLERSTAKAPERSEWPRSCAGARDALVSSHEMAALPALRDAVLVGFRDLEHAQTPKSLVEAFELAKKLPRVPARPGVTKPPAPSAVLVPAAAVDEAALLRAPLRFAREASALHVLSQDGRLCDLAAAGLRCHPLAKPGRGRFDFVATSRQHPVVVASPSEAGTLLLLPDGSELAKVAFEPNEESPTELHISADGRITSLHQESASERYGLEENVRVVRGAERMDLPPSQRELHVVGDFVLGRDGDRLTARPIESNAGLLGKPIDLGAAARRERVLTCSDGSVTGIVDGEDELMRWREGYLEMRVYRTPEWALVKRVPFAHAPDRRAGPPSLACGEGTATFVWVESVGTLQHLRRLRCTPTDCSEDSGDVREVSALGFFRSKGGVDSAVRAAPIGDAVALVWWSRDEALRISVGKPAELVRREVLFDASTVGLERFGGSKQWLQDLELVPLGDAVLVALSLGSKDVVLLRVDRDGHASAVGRG